MRALRACAVCGLTRAYVGGVFRHCAGRWTCVRCWDNIASTVLTQASSPDESAERAWAHEVLRTAARLASQ